MRMRLITSLVFLAMTTLGSCKDQKQATNSPTDFGRHKQVAEAFMRADRLLIYEGLPHPGWEQELFDQESERAEHVQSHGHAFYKSPVQPSAEDMKSMKDLFTGEDSMLELTGPKGCGLFYADWRIAAHVKADAHQWLVCFNCQEIKVYGSAPELHCDIARESAKQLKSLLEKYRTNRPKGGVCDSLLVD